jgi:two-component system, NtrC family, response regulator AtoC
LTENVIEITRVLVVSRDSAVVRLLRPLEDSNTWRLETAASDWEAMERVQSGAVPHLLLLDLPRGYADGLHFLRWLRRLRPELPVALLCHSDDASIGKEAARLGSVAILLKPFDAKQLESAIRRQLERAGCCAADSAGKNENIEAPPEQEVFFVSASLIMQKLRAQAALLAKSDIPVLIVGESGAGKYSVASLIHQLSVRSGFKLLRVNCAEMPESLLEAELFGADRGRSTGTSCPGKFAAGEKGTILLEEVAAMPAELQSQLLQLFQNTASGQAGTDAKPPEVRILASSSADLDRALAEGRLREDLYYVLSAFTVQVPPLRHRKDEIATLLRYFMHRLAKHYSLPPREFSASIFAACQRYSWPGNLKEMETFVKRYLVAGGDELTLGEMALESAGAEIRSRPVRVAASWEERGAGQNGSNPESKPESLKSLIQGVKSEAEQNAIGAALKRTGWNRKAAARLLRVSYRTLLYKIEQYHMRAPEAFLAPLPNLEFSLYDDAKGNGKAS